MDELDFLNFSINEGEEEERYGKTTLPSSNDRSCSDVPDVEEELEWLSNEDTFPTIDTFFDILPEETDADVFPAVETYFDFPSDETNPDAFPPIEASIDIIPSQQSYLPFQAEETVFDLLPKQSNNLSPTSVLEASSTSSNNTNDSSTIMSRCLGPRVPQRPRTKQPRRRGRNPNCRKIWLSQLAAKRVSRGKTIMERTLTIGRKCQHCGIEKTPQWREGPAGPKTLCNACGVRYRSGRLVPEYRPAKSPTFSEEIHSNSHRKIVEMRKRKHSGLGMNGPMMVKAADGYGI